MTAFNRYVWKHFYHFFSHSNIRATRGHQRLKFDRYYIFQKTFRNYILENKLYFFSENVSGTMIAKRTQGIATKSFWTLSKKLSLKLTSHQRLSPHRSTVAKIGVSGESCFSRITFELINIKTWQMRHRVSLVESCRMIYCLISVIKGHGQQLTSGQGHVMTKIGHVADQSVT